MKDFDALKDIWHGQKAQARLNYEDVLQQIKNSKARLSSKLMLETVGICVAIIVFVLIWLIKPFLMWTSYLSLLLLVLCCFYYLFVLFKNYRSLSESDSFIKEPTEHIARLKQYKKERYTLNTRNYTIYSVFIGIAFGLAFIEVYFVAPGWQAVTGFIFTLAWFIVCAFLMKNYRKKEQRKLEDIIQQLERVESQFDK